MFRRGAQRFPVPFRRGHVLAAYVRNALKLCREDDNGEA